MRLTIAFDAINRGVGVLAGSNSHAISVWAFGSLALTVGAAIFVGFLTPAAGAAAAVGYLMTGISSFLVTKTDPPLSTIAAFDLAAISVALVLLGPGAFSFDARLFGRREIIIPEG